MSESKVPHQKARQSSYEIHRRISHTYICMVLYMYVCRFVRDRLCYQIWFFCFFVVVVILLRTVLFVAVVGENTWQWQNEAKAGEVRCIGEEWSQHAACDCVRFCVCANLPASASESHYKFSQKFAPISRNFMINSLNFVDVCHLLTQLEACVWVYKNVHTRNSVNT